MKQIALIFLAIFLISTISSSQVRHEQVGEINIKMREKSVDPYQVSQDDAISFFKDLDTKASKIPTGVVSRANSLSKSAINYLTGTYLYCSVKLPPCANMVNAIFESDVINSAIEKNPSCPNMKAFWIQWQKNDMEQRQGFLAPITAVNSIYNFKIGPRAQIVQCEKTIGDLLAEVQNTNEFLKVRYSDNSGSRTAISETVKILETIKTNIPNIFIETGAQGSSSQAFDDKKFSKGKTSKGKPKKK